MLTRLTRLDWSWAWPSLLLVLCQEYPLAILQRPHCFCGYATPVFSLHDPVGEELCAPTNTTSPTATTNQLHCQVYQTPVQGKVNSVYRLAIISHLYVNDVQMKCWCVFSLWVFSCCAEYIFGKSILQMMVFRFKCRTFISLLSISWATDMISLVFSTAENPPSSQNDKTCNDCFYKDT